MRINLYPGVGCASKDNAAATESEILFLYAVFAMNGFDKDRHCLGRVHAVDEHALVQQVAFSLHAGKVTVLDHQCARFSLFAEACDLGIVAEIHGDAGADMAASCRQTLLAGG